MRRACLGAWPQGQHAGGDAQILVRRNDIDVIRLDAYEGPVGAGGFYARCGFREVARVTYRKTPLIYYELLLQDGRVDK